MRQQAFPVWEMLFLFWCNFSIPGCRMTWNCGDSSSNISICSMLDRKRFAFYVLCSLVFFGVSGLFLWWMHFERRVLEVEGMMRGRTYFLNSYCQITKYIYNDTLLSLGEFSPRQRYITDTNDSLRSCFRAFLIFNSLFCFSEICLD